MASLENIESMTAEILRLARNREDDIPLTRQQSAYYIGVSIRTFDNYVKNGRIKPTVRHGLVGYLKTELNLLK